MKGVSAMTLGLIESLLFIGMVGLIWGMLDILDDGRHANDKRKRSDSPDDPRSAVPAEAVEPRFTERILMVSPRADAH